MQKDKGIHAIFIPYPGAIASTEDAANRLARLLGETEPLMDDQSVEQEDIQ